MVTAPIAPELVQPLRLLQAHDLQRVSGDQAAAMRLLHDPRLAQLFSEIYTVQVHPQRAVATRARTLSIRLQCPGGVLTLGVPAELLPALALAASDPFLSALAVAPMVAARILGALMGQFGVAASSMGDSRWSALRVNWVNLAQGADITPANRSLASFEVTVANQFQCAITLESMAPGCCEALQELVSAQLVRQPLVAGRWRVPSMIRLATRSWSAALLASLRPGDLLICNDAGPPGHLDAQLFCGAMTGRHWQAGIRIAEKKGTIMSQTEVHEGSTELPAHPVGAPLVSAVAELEVPVHFEVDNAAMSLAELSALRPGYVIELSIPVEEAEVRLVSCGQIIGRGKLVVIGDCLGVQISHLVTGGM